MNHQRTSPKPNGHPGPNGRPNGRGPASMPAPQAGRERGGVLAHACTDRHQDRAASDDASGVSVASAAAYPAAAGPHRWASTGREACAEAAPPAPNGIPSQQQSAKKTGSKPRARDGENTETSRGDDQGVPPGRCPLPDNPAEFVQEIHLKIDLIEVWHSLLRSEDEKIRQRAIEKLTSILYDDGSISAEEPQQIVMDIDSAVARRAIAARQKELQR